MAGNKLLAFNRLNTVCSIPDFSESMETARAWIADGQRVLCRTQLRGSGGAGIVVASVAADLVPSPLFVKYVKKRKEFRLHVVDNSVIDVQEKRRRNGVTDRVPYIFNRDNGYVFCRNDVHVSDDAKALAVTAVRTLGLDFGAVDMIWNENRNTYYVLEVNCAPGLEGQTVENYGVAFERIANETRAL